MNNYTSEEIRQQLDQKEPGSDITLNLLKGETAWNPASTKHVIYGPATVRYVQYVDGGVTATVTHKS